MINYKNRILVIIITYNPELKFLYNNLKKFEGTDVLINSVCPGWVKTDMGGSGASRELPEGAAGIVWLATLPTGSVSGKFFRDRQAIEW